MQKYKDSIIYIIFIIIAIIFVVVKMQPKIVELYDTETQLSAKRLELSDIDRKLETLKAESAEKDVQTAGKNKKVYKSEEPGLDVESSFIVLFDDLIEMAKYNGIKIYSLEYVYNPVTDDFVKSAPDKYNVCQLNMQMISDYLDLENFFKEVYKYPYLVNLEKVEITSYPQDKKLLLVNLQLKLYSAK